MSSLEDPPEGSWRPEPDESWRGSSAFDNTLAGAVLPEWFNEKRFAEDDVAARLHAALYTTTLPIGSITNDANDWADRLSMPEAIFKETELFEFLKHPTGLSPGARFCIARAIDIDPSSLIEYDKEFYRRPPMATIEQSLFYPKRLRPVEFFLGAAATLGAYVAMTQSAAEIGYGESPILATGALIGSLLFGVTVVSFAGRWLNFFCNWSPSISK